MMYLVINGYGEKWQYYKGLFVIGHPYPIYCDKMLQLFFYATPKLLLQLQELI